MTTNTRIESDTLGPVEIPETALWGPQTERSRHNFQAGPLMPLPLIKALLQIKKRRRGRMWQLIFCLLPKAN